MKQWLSQWMSDVGDMDILLGYGSLMNADSRKRHSAIVHEGIPVTVKGYARGWVTRAYHEQQTYVGAWPDNLARMNAQLVPVTFNPSLQKRERDYRFEPVCLSQLEFAVKAASDEFLSWLESKKLWVCHSLEIKPSDGDFPVNASYVATCLQGCEEVQGQAGIETFVTQTQHWPDWINDDLDNPLYPRAAATLSEQDKQAYRKVLQGLPSVNA